MSYAIDKILEERTVDGCRWLLIKWEGKKKDYNTWEPAANLEDEDPEGKGGGEDEKEGIEQKFVDPGRVMVNIKSQLKAKGLNNQVTLLGPGEKATEPGLYLLLHEQHFYIIKSEGGGRGLVADGANASKRKGTKQIIEERTGIKLKALQYNGQTQPYHCGASAIVIALLLRRAEKRGETPREPLEGLEPTRKEIVRRLYREREPEGERRERRGARL